MREKYTLHEELGIGYSAVVRRGVEVASGADVAVKIIDKAKVNVRTTMAEVNLMAQLAPHKNLVRLLAVFEDENSISLVLERARGRELFERIMERGFLSEREAARVTRGVLEGLEFLHQRGVIHRDVKPENILFATESADSEIVLADFGLSVVVEDEDIVIACGTTEYSAPEVNFRRAVSFSSDVWSLGVVLYILLCGYHPFQHEDRSVFYRQLSQGVIDFPSSEWDGVSEQAKDLVRWMLSSTPSNRPTATAALSHPWFQMAENPPPTTSSSSTSSTTTAATAAEPRPGYVDGIRKIRTEGQKSIRKARNLHLVASIAERLFPHDLGNDFLKGAHYDPSADRAITKALFEEGSSEYDEFLAAMQDMTEEQVKIELEKVAKTLYPGEQNPVFF